MSKSPGDAEKALAAKARDGDRRAFAELIRRHRIEAFHVALGYMGDEDDAHDLVQEACLRALRHIHRFDVERPFFPWFYRILRNLCFNLRAKRKRRGECPLICERDGGVDPRGRERDPFETMAGRQKAELLWRALDLLRPEQREILLLRHFRDRSYQEIAEILDIPRGTVMSRLYYARAALRESLDRQLGEESASLVASPEPS